MPSQSFYLNSYSKYLDILREQSSSSGHSYLDLNRYKIPESTERTSFYWFEFHIMAEDYTRELVNGINRFFHYLRRLIVWSDILSTTDNTEERNALLIEFIKPLAFICLNKPYSLKRQFFYTSTHLLHLSNSQKPSESSVWEYKLIADGAHINYQTLNKVGKNWENFDSFSEALNAIENDEFKEKTDDFRNKSHHGIPPEIEFGITSPVRRTETKDGKVTQYIGGIEPLKIEDSINLLEQQHKACVRAFNSYWKLMGEQLESWK